MFESYKTEFNEFNCDNNSDTNLQADDTTKKRYSVFDYGDDELYVYDNKAYNGTDKVRTDTVTLKELLVNGRFANIRKAEWLAIKCEDTKIVIAKALKGKC